MIPMQSTGVPSKKVKPESLPRALKNTSHGVFAADTGYVKICPTCTARWSCDKKLVGVDRAVDIERCEICAKFRARKVYE
jgi:hypothetical protein